MFNAILRTQWKWSRLAALVGFVLGFAIPLLSLQASMKGRIVGGAMETVRGLQQFSPLYAFLAGGVGLAMAMLAWGHDHRGRHVYALSLPVSRARYAGMRFAAGSLFLLIPAIGVLIGCLVGIASVTIPEGLRAYPVALTLRFVFASFVAYAMIFAISSATTKASAYILGGLAGIVVLLWVLVMLDVGQSVLQGVASFLFADYGVLSVFTGRWMLVDV